MRIFITMVFALLMFINLGFSQSTSMVFYHGSTPDSMYLWPWGFTLDPEEAQKTGYTPGTNALRWVTSANDGWQGLFIGLNSNVGNDLTSIWETDSVYFKLRAPNGLAETDTLILFLYDSRNSDWEYTVYKTIDNFHDIQDGSWHQFSIALKDLTNFNNPINKSDIVAVSFETPQEGYGIESEMYIDHVWIGNPDLSVNLVIWNGQSLMPGIGTDFWGFENNDLVVAEGEGYLEGTPAILWETANWDWQGKGFYFDPQDMSYSWTVDSMKLKVKAPAGINDLVLVWYDWSDNAAKKVLNDVTWDGTWQILAIPLTDFLMDEGFDASTVYYFSIEANEATIPERILFDDIWMGNPSVSIDIVPPPAPENILVDVSMRYVNLIAWDNIESESGETYDVYASTNPITDLEASGVIKVASKVPEAEVAAHKIYYPFENGTISYYYAVTCTDAAGNKSESFGTTEQPAVNTGKKRAIISLNPPANFVADGDLSEWDHIIPFVMNPDSGNIYTGEIKDELDYSAYVYVAMDNENLYVAFDVFDDVFSWTESNTVDWWEDENIELYIGL